MDEEQINSKDETGAEEEATVSYLPEYLARVIQPRGLDAFIAPLLYLNYLLLFVRPQYTFPLIGQIYLTLICAVLPLPFLLMRLRVNWTKQTRAMVALIIFGAVMGPFVRNNFWAFHTWRDITQTFVCFLMPMIIFLPYGSSLRRLVALCSLIGAYLAFYAALHAGKGPGGFLGDENDNCLAILIFGAFPLFMYQVADSTVGKGLLLAAGVLMFLGVVSTSSRGGFLGVTTLALYYCIRSPSKLPMLIAVGLVGLGAFYLVPNTYWERISTIADTDQGTAKTRRHMWSVALRIFADRRNFLTGVGMENTPYYLADYENANDLSDFGRSIAGWQVHSLYVQTLSDLGLIGALILLYAIWISASGNRRYSRLIRRELKALPELAKRLDARAEKLQADLRAAKSETVSEDEPVKRRITRLEQTPWRLYKEFRFLVALFAALNGAIVGGLVASAFISVLYYPTIWFLFALSATAGVYAERLLRTIHAFDEIDREEVERRVWIRDWAA